ncbi:unnamed protein product [Zymoseptoria tritici ST99CH_1A5]|uniref:RRM domain-containing protein n=1 Tax=Zymoseptoria tritici ST99CH_1A5 TaxID=1276529 RepID=A0A1Y6LC42_ZYMTR|nr:unnamed protein product [Zymoseptoria tritici ST99CH_1A5]
MSDQKSPRLYVGNLPYTAQREDVMSLFAENGIGIKDLTMSMDAFTGRSPSYCFVDLHTEDDAGSALQTMQGQLVRGRPVRLSRNTERRQTSPDPKSAVVNKLNALRYNVGAMSHWTAPSMENRRLYVGGLPQIVH